MKTLIFFSISLISLIQLGCAQKNQSQKNNDSYDITVQLRHDTIGLNETVQIDYQVANAKQVNLEPEFKHFEVVSGPFQSSQYSMINGKTSSSFTISYVLKPLKTGSLLLERQTLYVDNEKVLSEDAAIVVLENYERPKSADRYGFGFDDDLWGRMQKQQEEMMKRHQELFQNPEFFQWNSPFFGPNGREFGPDKGLEAPKNNPQPKELPKKKEKTYRL